MKKSLTLMSSGTAQTIALPVTPNQLSVSASLKRLCSTDLFSGAKELVIEHAGDEYRLRQTNQGKLILTK